MKALLSDQLAELPTALAFEGSLEQLNELVEFYRSPLGRKITAVAPDVLRAAVQGLLQSMSDISADIAKLCDVIRSEIHDRR